MENEGLFEGDIVPSAGARNAIAYPGFLWPNRTIIYEIAPGFSVWAKERILSAMDHISEKTCIRFKPYTDEQTHVSIIQGSGCYSKVGKFMSAVQDLSLSAGCLRFGTILHELMHAVGFFHHHSRPDRDSYIEIHPENIQKGEKVQFQRLSKDTVNMLTPWDFDSITLYGEDVFSGNGKPTMTSKVPGKPLIDVGDKPGLSALDIEAVTKLYKC